VSSEFIKIGSLGELRPGKMKRVDVGGRCILLANVDGRFYATDDLCTHEDASLAAGSLRGELVKCPLHGSRFNVRTGEVLEEPAKQNLRTYPVQIEGNDILIGLPEEARKS
jgi:3-phenylpropionate/trans-cinnamate dioxygenase ferredoxin subunit